MGNDRVFSAVFEPRRNGLNFVRLMLAVGVILFHSFPLTGRTISWPPLHQFASQIHVDGFFAISGYLIVSSWMNHPSWFAYLRARVLRIFPAFWVCLILTALVVVPLTTGVFTTANLHYIVSNAGLLINQFDIAGTPRDVPYPEAWNGSLWTLFWEFGCYLAVLVFGLVGLLRRRRTILALFLFSVVIAVAVDLQLVHNFWINNGARFAPMFLAGAVIWRYRDRLPVGRVWIVGAVVIVLASQWLPDYRIVGAIPLAYLMLTAGALLKAPRFRLRNDLSYGVYIYAFLVQQVLAVWGLHTLNVVVFFLLSTACTLPLAAASWFAIEKPALRLKHWRSSARSVVVTSAAAEQVSP